MPAPLRRIVSSALIACVLLAAACSGSDPAPPTTTLDLDIEFPTTIPPAGLDGFDLFGVTLNVGDKGFTEQQVLANLAAEAAFYAGADVNTPDSFIATSVVRDALVDGTIDLYYEYSGIGWAEILGREEPATGDAAAQVESVRAADARNGIAWLGELGFSSTYVIVANPTVAAERSLATLGNAAPLAAELGMCLQSEFILGADGLIRLIEAGFDVTEEHYTELDPGQILSEVSADSETCKLGQVFATDAALADSDVVVLSDDIGAFIPEIPTPVTRADYLAAHPEVAELLAAVGNTLTIEILAELVNRVEIGGERPSVVARDHLTTVDLIR